MKRQKQCTRMQTKDTYILICLKVDNTQNVSADTLTDPEVIKPLAHGAVLVWDLIEVLVKARLEWDESRQGRKVVF